MKRRVPPRPVRRTWSWRDYFVVADKLSVAPNTKEGSLAVPMGPGNALQWDVTIDSANGSQVDLEVQGSTERENWVALPPATLGLIDGYWSGTIRDIPWPWVRLRLTWGGPFVGGPVIVAAGIHVAQF